MMCPLTMRDRIGRLKCGGRNGRCEKRYDRQITCELRDGENDPDMKDVRDSVRKIFRDAAGRRL
jgi:hypothetical protein